jgi:hypothetical protein
VLYRIDVFIRNLVVEEVGWKKIGMAVKITRYRVATVRLI